MVKMFNLNQILNIQIGFLPWISKDQNLNHGKLRIKIQSNTFKQQQKKQWSSGKDFILKDSEDYEIENSVFVANQTCQYILCYENRTKPNFKGVKAKGKNRSNTLEPQKYISKKSRLKQIDRVPVVLQPCQPPIKSFAAYFATFPGS